MSGPADAVRMVHGESQFVAAFDGTSGVAYRPWTDGWAIGYQCEWPDGAVSFIYMNPSGGSDDGVPSVTLYEGALGDPAQDPASHHYDLERPC